MAKITVYFDDELAEAVRKMSKSKNLSQSRVISDLVRDGLKNQWPDEVLALVGAWADFSTLEEISRQFSDDFLVERDQPELDARD